MTLHEAMEEDIPARPREVSLQQRTVNQPRVRTSGSVEGSPVTRNSGRFAGSAAAAALAVSSPKGSPNTKAPTEQVRNASAPVDTINHYDGTAKPAVAIPESEDTSLRDLSDQWPSTVIEEKEPEDSDSKIGDPQAREGRTQMTCASPISSHVNGQQVPPTIPQSLSSGQPEHQLHRQPSSPGRSARFAKLLEVAGTDEQVHQPPPRSVSPVKSALKPSRGSSSSPDRRLSATGRVHPSSELSDGTSVASDEGSRISSKKKSAKVSFDDEAEVVGVAASPPTSPEEYTPDPPPGNKANSRMSWLGAGKKKTPGDVNKDDWDVVMKPRKELPSFGSIRGNRGDGPKRLPIPEFSDNETSSSSESDIAPKEIIPSANHVIEKSQLHNPQNQGYFPPHNTDGLEQNFSNNTTQPVHQVSESTTKMETVHEGGLIDQQTASGANKELSVPAIAVEPATPPPEEPKKSLDLKRSSMDQYKIPGGFPPSGSERSLKSAANNVKAPALASGVPDVDPDEDYSDSIYSDAPEDIGIDGDGYGSINAIVGSRVAPRSAPAQPLDTTSESRDATPKPLNRASIIDFQFEDRHDQGTDVRPVTPTQASSNPQVHGSHASTTRDGYDPVPPPLQVKPPARNPQRQNGSIQTQPSTRARPMSVAVDTGGAFRMQDPRYSSNEASPQSTRDKSRPLSVGPSFHRTGEIPGFPASLRRKTSNGSDSSSSFKRSSPRGDLHSMRRTMRAGAGANAQTQPQMKRNESPLDHRPMSSGSSNGTMRKTLRGPAGGERYSFFSTNKKAPPRAKFTKQPPRLAHSTRFANSDGENEDEARPQTFLSRFADSSDEEGPHGNALRPVRGIPRRQGADDGDSTELEDSSEEGARQQAQTRIASAAIGSPPGSRGNTAPHGMSGMAAVAKQRGMSQRELEEFIMAPPTSRKPSILTRLGLKKSKNSNHRIRQSDTDTASKRNPPLEPSPMELDQIHNGSPIGNYTTISSPKPTHPRLVKRNSQHQPSVPESWPLDLPAVDEPLQPVLEQPHDVLPVQNPEATTLARNGSVFVNGNAAAVSPITKEVQEPPGPDPNNDGVLEVTNPEGHSARDVVIAGSGRKKRFPLLRKAFGLRA